MNVADDLAIFWNSENGQDEVRGLYLYGLMRGDVIDYDYDAITEAWNPISVQLQESKVESELGKVAVVAVKLLQIPDAQHWRTNLDQSLSVLLRYGAIVAWAGGEDCSWSPDVLDPGAGVGNVLAAKSTETGFLCNGNIDDEIVFLSDSQLESIWTFLRQNTAGQDT